MSHRFVTEERFANTYEKSGWEVVKQYRTATALATETDLTQREIADNVGRPTSAVRGWLSEGKTPRVVSGLEIAEQSGWIEADSSSETFRCLNQLVAWVFSGGGLQADYFVPTFSVDDAPGLSAISSLFASMDLPIQIARGSPAETEVSMEVRPAEAASVLGRVLHVLGVPRGIKANEETISLPNYLSTVSESLKADFARVYLFNRCGVTTGSMEQPVIGESRSLRYLIELRDFLGEITETQPTIKSQNRLWLSRIAVRNLAISDDIRGDYLNLISYGSVYPPTDRLLASTYRRDRDPSGWDYLRAYRTVSSATDQAEFSELIATTPGLTTQTIRNWQRGHSPTVAKAVETAEDHGWLSPHPRGTIAVTLSALAGWIQARGSLQRRYHPIFRFRNPSQRTMLEEIATVLELSTTVDKQSEFRFTSAGSVIGRLLFALGVSNESKSRPGFVVPPYAYTNETIADHYLLAWVHQYGVTTDTGVRIELPSRFPETFAMSLSWLVEHASTAELVQYPELVLDEASLNTVRTSTPLETFTHQIESR